jgi:hypothetical protein
LQYILFDDFQIWEGRCAPGKEPFASEVQPVVASWPELRTDFGAETSLTGELVFDKAFVGGGCGGFEITNKGTQACENFELEINVRPTWGTILTRDGQPSLNGLIMLENDAQAGVWFFFVNLCINQCESMHMQECDIWMQQL